MWMILHVSLTFKSSLYWDRIPINFNLLCTSINQVHSHATRTATQGGYLWQLSSTVRGKRSLKYLGPTSGTVLILPYMNQES